MPEKVWFVRPEFSTLTEQPLDDLREILHFELVNLGGNIVSAVVGRQRHMVLGVPFYDKAVIKTLQVEDLECFKAAEAEA